MPKNDQKSNSGSEGLKTQYSPIPASNLFEYAFTFHTYRCSSKVKLHSSISSNNLPYSRMLASIALSGAHFTSKKGLYILASLSIMVVLTINRTLACNASLANCIAFKDMELSCIRRMIKLW